MAAKSGNVAAMFKLALCYEDNVGVPNATTNDDTANKWRQKVI
jgi:TPR repeat protein